jgi:hypothetical protein
MKVIRQMPQCQVELGEMLSSKAGSEVPSTNQRIPCSTFPDGANHWRDAALCAHAFSIHADDVGRAAGWRAKPSVAQRRCARLHRDIVRLLNDLVSERKAEAVALEQQVS